MTRGGEINEGRGNRRLGRSAMIAEEERLERKEENLKNMSSKIKYNNKKRMKIKKKADTRG